MNVINELPKKAAAGVLIAMLFSGCSLLPDRNQEDEQDYTPSETELELHQTQREQISLSDLMLQRKELCSIPAADRLRLLDDYRSVFSRTDQSEKFPLSHEFAHQLHALMLASCEPVRTPDIYDTMLHVVTASDDWPEDYLAFFDLLLASHEPYLHMGRDHAQMSANYQALQNQHRELKNQHEALQKELENTIKGISDIERGIDLPEAESTR